MCGNNFDGYSAIRGYQEEFSKFGDYWTDETLSRLSTRKLRDECGGFYYGIDMDIRDRLRAKLMRAILAFHV